jgi:hypothetical protein
MYSFYLSIKKAVPWHRQLVTGFSPWRPRSVHAVDKVALGQGFLQVIQFYPVSIILPWLSIFISSGDEQKAC